MIWIFIYVWIFIAGILHYASPWALIAMAIIATIGVISWLERGEEEDNENE